MALIGGGALPSSTSIGATGGATCWGTWEGLKIGGAGGSLEDAAGIGAGGA